jgi:hypothetical protein
MGATLLLVERASDEEFIVDCNTDPRRLTSRATAADAVTLAFVPISWKVSAAD